MRIPRPMFDFESAMDYEIMEAYINKNTSYNKSEARKIKRELRKLNLLKS